MNDESVVMSDKAVGGVGSRIARVVLYSLILVYVGILVWLSMRTVDDAVYGFFEGQGVWVLIGYQFGFYLGLTLLTVWLVGLLYRFTNRLANPRETINEGTRIRGLVGLVSIFICHAISLIVMHLSGSRLGLLSYGLAFAFITGGDIRNSRLRGLQKVWVPLPLFLYALADVIIVAAVEV